MHLEERDYMYRAGESFGKIQTAHTHTMHSFTTLTAIAVNIAIVWTVITDSSNASCCGRYEGSKNNSNGES
jgi:hypothetical protein